MAKTSPGFKDRMLIIVLGLGILTALLSLLEPGIEWISALCGVTGGSCRETAAYSLLGLNPAWWGLGYYLSLGLIFRCRNSLMAWGVWAGWGVEITLISIMARDALVCPLCLFNFGLMTVLLLLYFDSRRIWQSAAVVLMLYTVSGFLVTGGADRLSAGVLLARAAGQDVYAHEVERPLTTQIYKLEEQIYKLKTQSMNRRINSILIKKEAGSKGISVEKLTADITRDVQPPRPGEVDHYYRTGQYKRWGIGKGSEAEIKKKIRDLVFTSLKQKQLNEYCLGLRNTYPVEIFLEAPPVPISQIPAGKSPARGPETAKVTIIEFSDYLCPSCKKGHETVKQIREKYRGKIRWVFKDFPLNIHPGARDLAVAARCAGDQGKFWAFQDLLFESPRTPGTEELRQFARTLALDPARFERCMSSPEFTKELEKDIQSYRRSGIAMTPTLIVNGRLHTGIPDVETFSRIIETAMQESPGE